MEKKGIEWVCPKCLKKKNEENKSKSSSKKHRNSTDSSLNEQKRISKISNTSSTSMTTPDVKVTQHRNSSTSSNVTFCVVCKKEARKSSIYCSDTCILTHAQETSTKDKPVAPTQIKVQKIENKQQGPKPKSDIRILIYNKITRKVLTGKF